MPMSNEQLNEHLQALRSKGSESMGVIEDEFGSTVDWMQNFLISIRSGKIEDNTVLIPKTPKAPSRHRGRQLPQVEEDVSYIQKYSNTSNVVTSSATTSRISRSGLRKTSHSTKYQCEDEEENSESDSSPIFSAHKKTKKTYSSKSSKLSKNSEGTRDESAGLKTPQSCNDSICANSTLRKNGHTLPMQSNETNLKVIKKEPRESLSIEDEIAHVFTAPLPLNKSKKKVTRSSKVSKKGQECDSTSLGASPGEITPSSSFTRESICANITYVKEGSAPKESIGANRTYVKESIGANCTYVKESPGAYTTSVNKEILSPKESIGANRTYVKESIGANSTYVLDSSKKAGSESDVYTPDGVKSADATDQNTSVLEASRMAVEEAMNGPTRVTRTKARAVAKNAAQAARSQITSDASVSKKTSNSEKRKSIQHKSHSSEKQRNNGIEATLKMARKSLTRAKQVAVGKMISSASTTSKGPVSLKPAQFYKVVSCHNNRVRSASQSEQSSGNKYRNHARTLSQTDEKIPVWSKDHRINQPRHLTGNPLKAREDRLQELAAKTLHVCKKKEEMLKKQTEQKAKVRQQKRERVLSARDEMERERALLRLIQENEQGKVQEAQNQKKMEERAKQDLLMKQKPSKEHNLQRLAQEGLSYLAKPLDERAALPHASTSKCIPAAKPLNNNHTFEVSSYDLTLNPEDRQPLPSKDADNYGLDDVNSGDSSDDESNPKKVVPEWAQVASRQSQLLMQYAVPQHPLRVFFGSQKTTPDLTKIFHGIDCRLLSRRSSAVWHSPS